MITLAIDTATARCTVAVTDGVATQEAHVDGPRRHTREALGLVDGLLREIGADPGDIVAVLSGDGPGSFTGLRVATSIAKALTWGRPAVTWHVSPSLLIQGMPHITAQGGGRLLAVTDALRGDLYAGCWDVVSDRIAPVNGFPRSMAPADLAAFGSPVVVVGDISEQLAEAVRAATGLTPITGAAALPDARALLTLARVSGGTAAVTDPGRWSPTYGRPVEAQAVWERKHGRILPDQTYRPG
ncbi:MAG TPA: tRNA (adenosine(37)-N6)-threonylcarbamoyltransferase complex dimerization subunit type 1 TsaB [Gemmatimonadales bacterium]|nr:tRNA (adenosine(37)-N6)-threonylcarbamoyltransferase complex dimerization subunit type 1 TsaB [Gemmatimonadales bacterium]